MRKFTFVVVLLFIVGAISYYLFRSLREYRFNPYSGKYLSKRGNVILILNNNDDNCTIINNEYRDVFSTKAKYLVVDNRIKIRIDNKYNYVGKSFIKGVFEGNSLKLGNDIYYKK
ncbi:hypothetical protein NL50_13180 [Clostridium acetobutylicum]|nr:hypothetical protein NL50_13180 [Clostridium acetobutylicum]